MHYVVYYLCLLFVVVVRIVSFHVNCVAVHQFLRIYQIAVILHWSLIILFCNVFFYVFWGHGKPFIFAASLIRKIY